MCGLVGIYTSRPSGLFKSDADEFFHLLLVNSVRGAHSTGVAGIDLRKAETEAEIVKTVGNPYNLTRYEDFGEFEKRFVNKYSAVIGHGRYATQGAINAINAHPFKEGRIVGAHNGVIRNFKQLQSENKDYAGYEVDSQLIFRMFNDIGVEETIKQIDGAFTFMWFDTLEGTFNVVRNSERPLFMGKYQSSDTLVFGSERETLLWNSTRNKTPLVSIDEVPTATWLSFDGLSIIPERKTVELKKWYYQGQQNGGYRNSMAITQADTGRRRFIGQTIEFDIENYFAKESRNLSYFQVEGTDEVNPIFKFVGTLWDDTEEEIIQSSRVIGEICEIVYSIQHGVDVYTCRLSKCRLIEKEVLALPPPTDDTQEEERVSLIDAVSSIRHGLTFHRVSQLADRGCAYCQSPIEADSVKNFPNRYAYWDGMSSDDSGIVCPSCNGMDVGCC